MKKRLRPVSATEVLKIYPGVEDPCDVQKAVKAYLDLEAGEILPDERGDIKTYWGGFRAKN